MCICANISYKDYIILYFTDKTYISCFADVLIIGSILVCYGSFLASQEFFEKRKNELLASGNVHINFSIAKLKSYLCGFIILNLVLVILMLWVFWPVEYFLLFFLNYRVHVLNIS